MASPSPIETSPSVPATAEANVASRGVSRSIQHQAQAPASRRAFQRVAGHNPQYDWPDLCRAGFLQCGLTLSRCSTFMTSYLARAAARVLSHSHSLGFSSLTSDRPALRVLPHRGVGQTFPVRAFVRSAGAFIITRSNGANRSPRHSLTGQQFSQCLAGSVHLSAVLSSSPSFDGFKTIGKAFDEWTKTNFRIGQK